MKRRRSNLGSYAVVATIAAAAGSVGTLLAQHYSKNKPYDHTNDTFSEAERDFTSDMAMTEPVYTPFAMEDPTFNPTFSPEAEMADPAMTEYDDKRLMDFEQED